MKEILDTILDPGSRAADFAVLPLPEAYRAVTLHRDEEHMFDGLDACDRDPRKSLHTDEVRSMGAELIIDRAAEGG